MPEYLSKEEIKQWRSSLEKITLEDFATRLGKQIEEEKQTKDIIDIVLKGKPYTSTADTPVVVKAEKITSIAQRAVERERQVVATPFTSTIVPAAKVTEPKVEKGEKEVVSKKEKQIVETPVVQTEVKSVLPVETQSDLRKDVQITFKKALTDREQMVFEYLLQNQNKIVFAKDLAVLLGLPRDYVYKYIKNLRAKIDGENLKNADSGGFLLTL